MTTLYDLAEARFNQIKNKYKNLGLKIELNPDHKYFIAYNDSCSYNIDYTYVYEKVEDLDRTIDTLERHLENFTKFKKIENDLKDICKSYDWYIDSFIDGDEMNIKIKTINKYYVTSMVFNFMINDNVVDLSARLKYELNTFSHNIFNKELKITNNNIKFNVKNELGTERQEYYNDSYLFMESEFETEIKYIPLDNILITITDVIKATKENNYLLDTINYFN